MKFEWISDWDEVWSDKFQSRWNKWMDMSDNSHVFFHPVMVKAWVKTYLPIRDIQPLFCIATYKETVVFLPLVIWKKNWKNAFIHTVVPVGYSDFDYHTPVIIGDKNLFEWSQFWKCLQKEIRQKWSNRYDILEITGVEEEFIDIDVGWKEIDESPLIELSKFESYKALLGALKSKVRGDINRQLRRLKELGSFEYRIFRPDEVEEALAVLPLMIHHHSLRWPNAYKAPEYHANLIKEALPAGLLHFSQICIDGEPVCWNLSFVYRRTYYFYMPTYVEEYRKYSPGKVNMFLSMAEMFEEGYEKFDLLRGAEEYKSKLPTVTTKIYALRETNDRLISQVKNKIFSLKQWIR